MHVTKAHTRPYLLGSTWDPSHTFLATSALGSLPYPPSVVALAVAPWNDAAAAMNQSVAAMKAAIDTFTAYAQANDNYMEQAKQFYEANVKAHGSIYGIADAFRVKAVDIGILGQGVNDSKALLSRAIRQISNLMSAKSTSGMPATTAASGGSDLVIQKPNSGAAKPASAASYLLPIGAAVAAYFALK